LIIFSSFYQVQSASSTPRPTPPPIGGNVPPPSSGGGGGGGGGSSYSAPVFTPYVKSLKSSDGSIIGRLDGKDFNSVQLWAEKNDTIGNVTYALTITGELSHEMPDNCWLDVDFQAPDLSGLPKGMYNELALAVINVSLYPRDSWSFKSGTLKYVIKISNSSNILDPGAIYYFVRFDGNSYVIQNIDGSGAGSSPITFNLNPFGNDGKFTLMKALDPVQVTPTPMLAISTPIPSSAPAPGGIGVIGIASYIIVFFLGAISTIASLYIVFMRGKN
jgi:hypothetical protein